jgi:hypothetical protein
MFQDYFIAALDFGWKEEKRMAVWRMVLPALPEE